MSWDIFRSNYKTGLENGEDMATVISDSYHTCIQTGVPEGPIKNLAPAPFVLGNVSGLKNMLTLCFSTFGETPLSIALNTGLVLYWLGGTFATGTIITLPGITSAWIDDNAKTNESLDDTIEMMISSFNIHLKQIQGINSVVTPPPAAPTLMVGYKVQG